MVKLGFLPFMCEKYPEEIGWETVEFETKKMAMEK
jgi:hypothetical protein